MANGMPKPWDTLKKSDRLDREVAEYRELGQLATRSTDSRGRAQPEEPDPLRTAFERDRDRIIHSNAIRRLAHKTQVFINPEGDHFVTRLTHTLQVAQIGCSMAAALGLNEALTEAFRELRDFMFVRVYLRPEHEPERRRALGTVQNLVRHYEARPEEIPVDPPPDSADRETALVRAVDYVAGMTDRFAIKTHRRLCEYC